MKVVLASKNRHKLEEISQITRKFDMELVLQSELGVDIDVEETGTTFEENSFLKAEAVFPGGGTEQLPVDLPPGLNGLALRGHQGDHADEFRLALAVGDRFGIL